MLIYHKVAQLAATGDHSDLSVADIWLSVSVEGEDLNLDGGGALTDWRIVVSPPLTILNQLPTEASLLVWEMPEVQSWRAWQMLHV